MGKYPCPSCGYLVFAEPCLYDICPICFWEDDVTQLRFVTYSGGANKPSLYEAQKNYRAFGASQQDLSGFVRHPNAEDQRDLGWRPVDLATDLEMPGKGSSATYPDDPTALYYWRETYWRRKRHGDL